MRDVIVVDTESQRLASEVPGGWGSIHLMGFACGVVYSEREDTYMIYGHDEVQEFRNRLLRADEIISFNGQKFDMALAWELPGRQMPRELLGKSNDLYARICVASGRNPNAGYKGFGLGAFAERHFGLEKLENGADAPGLFRAGRFARLHSYCMSDVRLTRDLARFIEKEGYVLGPKSVRIEVPKWQGRPNAPQTLPPTHGTAALLPLYS